MATKNISCRAGTIIVVERTELLKARNAASFGSDNIGFQPDRDIASNRSMLFAFRNEKNRTAVIAVNGSSSKIKN